ncbi:uncharacterized protein LOC110866751 [Helianthus annuus]|uniref:uncharacterized protein LOC110866751 n=1 Tax=Helianthus annuus TaxID=4232 RepID=UPI000B905307|nr:uncharacterized protein LOC110866751 [Helianthus annuus]
MELARYEISYPEEEMVNKLFDALPNDQEWQYFALMLKNTIKPDDLKVDLLIERHESHVLEIKRSKVNSPAYQQNVELYYRGNAPQAGSPKTAFSAEKVLPEKDAVGYAFVANDDHDAWWRRDSARWEIRKLNEPFPEAQRAKRWNEDEGTFNTRRVSDKGYLPNLMNKLMEVFEASLPKVVEMRKGKEEELKKLIEEVKADAKTAAEKAQKSEEKENAEEKEGKEENAVEDQKAEKEDLVLKENEVPNGTEDCEIVSWSSLAQEEVEEPWFCVKQGVYLLICVLCVLFVVKFV